jgi:hypothetical protein
MVILKHVKEAEEKGARESKSVQKASRKRPESIQNRKEKSLKTLKTKKRPK